jgi:hypothetical protein
VRNEHRTSTCELNKSLELIFEYSCNSCRAATNGCAAFADPSALIEVRNTARYVFVPVGVPFVRVDDLSVATTATRAPAAPAARAAVPGVPGCPLVPAAIGGVAVRVDGSDMLTDAGTGLYACPTTTKGVVLVSALSVDEVSSTVPGAGAFSPFSGG